MSGPPRRKGSSSVQGIKRQPSLLFVNQHYAPDFASTGQHLTDLAEHLAQEGFEVHVLCGSGRYQAGSLEAPRRELRNGVHVHRFNTTAFGRKRHLGRLLDYASFYVQVLWDLLRGGQRDLLVVLTTPPLLVVASKVARRLRGQRYGIWSMDLHPDAEEAAGMLKRSSFLARVLHRLNDAGYRGADLVVDLGPYMKRRIVEKGVAPERLHTIPVWSKAGEIEPVSPAANPLREVLGLKDEFVVMYSGNAGIAHRFEEVLGAMERLRDDSHIKFIFVGGGPRRASIERHINEKNLTNARYLEYFPRNQLAQSLSIGDAHLLTLQESFSGIAVPGKLYGIMAAGRPTIVVGPRACEPSETVLDHDIGVVIDPAEGTGADRLARVIRALASERTRSVALGQRARKVFEAKYEQHICCTQWAMLLGEQLGFAVPSQAARPTEPGKAFDGSTPLHRAVLDAHS